ncbi:MAG TPA: type VI secretion system baseplate subunit TssK, partial [Paracoccaceae bacterium]|nr:type VI secretion system baseplate subunit TssK [Paracoccaceae bacterium]
MSWNAKVAWTEGLFLRPQHFQQQDRYHEHTLAARVGRITPYPWGVTALEIDHDLAQQGKFGVRRCAGIMPDGMTFDIPDDAPLPEPLELDERMSNTIIGLSIPAIAKHSREIDFPDADSASRYWRANGPVIDSAAATRGEEEIDLAHPRLSYAVLDGSKSGYTQIGLARVVEIQDKTIVFDNRYLPPAITTHAHAAFGGVVDRVIGWIETKLEELARYAADPTSGGGLQYADYFILQVLNREIPVLRHMRGSQFVHPERLYERLASLAGELATFATQKRMANVYDAYDHDDLTTTFHPVLRDLQSALSARMERRAVRLELIERAQNAYVSPIRDRALFQHASFILEVASARPLTDIQVNFPQLFKVGPSTKMQEIVHAHLPGVPLIHTPTPPRQIRALSDHVYFRLDRQTPLWAEFSQAPAVGMHFSGDWPDLKLEFWAVRE